MRALFFRLLARDFRAGQLSLLGLALAVSVFAMTTVLSLADRFERSLQSRAASLLAADVLLVSDRPIQPELLEQAKAQGLGVMQTAVFPAMVSVGEQTMLASIKAVSSSYPLRGRLELQGLWQQASGVDRTLDRPPPAVEPVPTPTSRSSTVHEVLPGTVWLEQSLLDRLQAQPGDRLRLGESRFRIAGVIREEPDRVAAFINFAPRLMMHQDDLQASGLIQEGSRITWRMGLAHPDPAILKRWVAKKELTLEKGQRIETQEAGRPEIQLTMQRARGFLGLIASVIAIVACAAIALASRHYANSHQRQYAVMRVMGASAAYLFGVVVLQFITLGLFAGGIGAMLGVYAGDWLASLIPVKLAQQLPPADIAIALQALAAGMLMLFCFSLGGWLQLLGVTPNVLFRDQTPGQIFQAQSHRKILAMFRSSLPWLVMILACLGLSVWLSDSLRSALWLWSGLILVLCLLALLLAVFYQIARTTGESLPASYLAAKLAFRRLGRTPVRRAIQQSASTLGVLALLLLSFVQDDLISGWQRASNASTPDRFLLNIQNDQYQEVVDFLDRVVKHEKPQLYPMVRARLISRNGQAMQADDFEELRAKRLLDREFNLSYGEGPIEGNRLLQGQWPRRGLADASVEQGLAKTLGLSLGDELEFEIAGETVKAVISSIRALSWESMRVNFFVVLSPQLLENQAQSWIASLHSKGIEQFDQQLNRRFPNITAVDLTATIEQAKSLVEQLTAGLRWLFLLALISGALVIAASLQLEQEERQRDVALMRVLGASPGQLRWMLLTELLLAGFLGGLLAGVFAYGLGLLLGHELLELPGYGRSSVIVAGVLIQIAVSMMSALFAIQQLFRRSAGDAVRLTN